MPRKRLLIPLCLLACLLATMPSSAQDGRVVHVGLTQFEPLIFEKDGRPQGLFVDILEEVAEVEGWRLEYFLDTWEGNLSRVADGDIDLLPALAYHVDRDRYIDYTSEQVMAVWSQVYLRPDSEIRSVFDLDGRRVAVVKGDVNGRNFMDYVEGFGLECTYVEVSSLDEIFRLVASGEAAANVAPNIFGFAHARKYDLRGSPIVFSPNGAYFGVPKGTNADLLAALDEALASWHDSESTFLEDRIHVWLGGHEFGERGMPRWLLIVAGSIAAMVLLMSLWLRALNHQVRARTRDLQRSEQRFRNLFETAGDSIFIMDGGRFVDCNDRTLEIFRCRREEIVGHEPKEFSPEFQPDGRDSESAAREHIESAMAGNLEHFDWTHRRGDDTDFAAEVTLASFLVDDRPYIQAIVRDVTKRHQLESDLRQAQKMEAIGNLAGGIAHDFNNILAAILGFGELARDDAPEGTELRENLEHVMRGGERARDLVRQILAFGQRAMEVRRHLEVADLVDETLPLLRSSLPATVSIKTDIRNSGPVLADPTGIHQILMNLCTNAGQALGGEDGEVHVTLYETAGQERDEVVIEVRDTGPGMDPETQQKIFEPYFTTKSDERGTGLGLAVVHGVVSGFDGRIEVESTPGEGALFRVTLPRNEGESRSTDEAESWAPDAPATRVLLVDDELEIITAGVRALERRGLQVTGCVRPEGALAIFSDDPGAFDVLVTDMTMPGLSGTALCERIREIRPELPVVLCTGYTDAVTAEAAAEKGVSAFLVKPVTADELVATIDGVLSGLPV